MGLRTSQGTAGFENDKLTMRQGHIDDSIAGDIHPFPSANVFHDTFGVPKVFVVQRHILLHRGAFIKVIFTIETPMNFCTKRRLNTGYILPCTEVFINITQVLIGILTVEKYLDNITLRLSSSA